ncbi:MAG: trigger factor [Trueperaceae bacterium]|nr:MAG: trigger factor [Trueperaceae bacterium]
MEAQLIDRQAVQATIRISVPAQEVDEAYNDVLRGLAHQVKIPGFRPGKAPRGVLVRRIGKEALGQEVKEALLDEHYPNAVRQLELSVVHAHFSGEAPEEGNDYVFEVEVDLYPDFTLPKIDEIVIDTERRAVTEEMISSTVERLKRDYATLIPVERPAAAGDYLLIETVNDEGESGSSMPVDLETAGEEVAEQFIGRELDDVFELELQAPDAEPGSTEDEEAGEAEAEAEAHKLRVKITDIKEREKPEPDDEFAQTLGFETWEETHERIKSDLQAQLDQQVFEEQREELIEKLVAETNFEVPKSLLGRRKRTILEDLSRDLKRQNLTLEAYLSKLEEDEGRAAFDEQLNENALLGVRRDLVLERLLEERKTTISDEEFSTALRRLAAAEGKDVSRFRREAGDAWLNSYRFLLARDRALKETVEELTQAGEQDQTATEEGPEETEGA